MRSFSKVYLYNCILISKYTRTSKDSEAQMSQNLASEKEVVEILIDIQLPLTIICK